MQGPGVMLGPCFSIADHSGVASMMAKPPGRYDLLELDGIRNSVHNEEPEKRVSLQDLRREEADIVRALRQYGIRRNRREQRVSISAIAGMTGLDRSTIYEARRGIMSERVRAVLLPVIASIERGELRFRRVGQVWEYRQQPDRLPPPQPRVIPASDYREWARCQSCGSPHFSRFTADKVYYACDTCVGLADRQMLGAR
jgi:hypothetical protein